MAISQPTYPIQTSALVDHIGAYADTKQPSDADLTAIAALTTTAYGRAFLALADAAAAKAAINLGNVDNTSDASKPVSAAQATAIALKQDAATAATDAELAAVKGGAMGVVIHGSNASAPRPTGYAVIFWIGTVAPTNSIDNDLGTGW